MINDAIYLAIIVGFFVSCAGYIWFCDRSMNGGSNK